MALTRTPLDERAQEILRTVIRLHISTGEPVGSETLSRALERSPSPATLRTIMGELERLGYLTHPHTSAGRVPTDEGYRFYVDSLRDQLEVPAREAAAIDSELRPRPVSPARLLENASHVLSRLTGQVGFALPPDLGLACLRRIGLVPLSHPRVLVVLVFANGLVSQRVIEVDEPIRDADLQACGNYLNDHFAGLTLPVIRAQLIELMREEKAAYDALLQRVIAVGGRALATDLRETPLYLDGTSHILDQAEFVDREDVDRLRGLFRTFEEKGRLVRILNACLAGEGLRVIIGHENPDPRLSDLSLVVASCAEAGEGQWGLGVLGSTRMPYPRVVAVVSHVAKSVTQTMREFRG